MTVPVSVRFEVFKRDRFTCSYCGKHPPEVLLEADHIIPLAAGGSSDLANLTTACTDCNRGKGARLLEEGTGPAINRAAVAEMHERVEQAQAYMESLGTLTSLIESQVQRANDAWGEAFGAVRTEREDGVYWMGGYWPETPKMRRFVKTLGLERVLDAIDIAAGKFARGSREGAPWDSVRYFYGTCHGMARERLPDPRPVQEPSEDERVEWTRRVWKDGYEDGLEKGAWRERQRLGEILKDYQGNGYESVWGAINAIWPDPD